MNAKKSLSSVVGRRADKPFKATIFESERLMLGVNCLEPGQMQEVHTHKDQDKFYFVQSGVGTFTVGAEIVEGRAGDVIWTPAQIPHGVQNAGSEVLTLMVGIAPAPK